MILAGENEKDTTAKQTGENSPLVLPNDAVQTEPYTWHHKDADGRIWIYRRTPFGLVRYEEEEKKDAEKNSEAKQSDPLLQAFDEGDSVRFERTTPFGKHRWTRKKTELTSEEREAFQYALKNKKVSTGSAHQE